MHASRNIPPDEARPCTRLPRAPGHDGGGACYSGAAPRCRGHGAGRLMVVPPQCCGAGAGPRPRPRTRRAGRAESPSAPVSGDAVAWRKEHHVFSRSYRERLFSSLRAAALTVTLANGRWQQARPTRNAHRFAPTLALPSFLHGQLLGVVAAFPAPHAANPRSPDPRARSATAFARHSAWDAGAGSMQPVYRRACCLGGRCWLAHVAWCPALHGLAQTPARQRPRRTQPDAHGAKPSPNSTMPNVRGSSFNRDRSRRALQHRSRLLPAPPGAAPRSRRRRTATSSCARRLGAEVVRNARCGCDTCMRGFPARASGCWGALLNSCLRRR